MGNFRGRPPYNVNAQLQKATHYYQTSELSKAEKICRKTLKVAPNNPSFLNLAGIIASSLGRKEKAVALFNRAVGVDSENPNYRNNLSLVLLDQGEFDEAIFHLRKTIDLQPNLPEPHYNMGKAFEAKGEFQKAILFYERSLQLAPSYTEAFHHLVLILQETYLWEKLDAEGSRLDVLTQSALKMGTLSTQSPFLCLSRHQDDSLVFAVSKSWSDDMAQRMSQDIMLFSFDDRDSSKQKISVAYLSNDFRDHPTSHLMLSLFGLHDRREFRISCYSSGPDDGSYYREEIRRNCDAFVDVADWDYSQIAKRIYRDKVDILVELNGHTTGSRMIVCALRPAPIKVSYLGFPGTTGADFFDYIITDRIVTPKDRAIYYSEKPVYMPHCYQVNDHKQKISDTDFTRLDFGLPDNNFVFCSFNRGYKIDPIMFDAWMDVLRQTPHGVLWLFGSSEFANDNLRSEAELRGVSASRLIFGKKLQKAEHLARIRLADLALDTRIYNGHTTTSDALWAGVPVITIQGNHFASRVSSSLLTSIGLPELITSTIEEYKNLAVHLANDLDQLKAIRERIASNRLVEPLFDTGRFVNNLEKAYKQMWEVFLAGERPRQMEVVEN